MSTLIIPVNIPKHPNAVNARIDEIRAPRVAFNLLDAENKELFLGISMITELQEPYLPITEEKLRSAIEGAFPEPEEE